MSVNREEILIMAKQLERRLRAIWIATEREDDLMAYVHAGLIRLELEDDRDLWRRYAPFDDEGESIWKVPTSSSAERLERGEDDDW